MTTSTLKKWGLKWTIVIGFVLFLTVTATAAAYALSPPVESDDMVSCMALHCPKPGGGTDNTARIIEIKQKIESLRQEILVLEKELHSLYDASNPPKPPVSKPFPPPPPPPVQDVASIKQAIAKWQKLLDDPSASDDDKGRAKEEIRMLERSLNQPPPVVPPPPPRPCLGAYLDASGQVRNACEEAKPQVLPPVTNSQGSGNKGAVQPPPRNSDNITVCMALNCPKAPTPPKVVTPPEKTPPRVVTPPAKTPPRVTPPPTVVRPPVKTPPKVVTPPAKTPPRVVTPPKVTPPPRVTSPKPVAPPREVTPSPRKPATNPTAAKR